MRHKNDSAGFTLVETMFASVVGIIVLGMIMILYVGVNNSMARGVALAEINSDARLVMDRIVRDVRWSTQLETTRLIGGTLYVTGDNVLILKIPAIDTGGDAIANTYDYVVYTPDASDPERLRKIVDPDAASSRVSSDHVIAKNINSFSLSSSGTTLSNVPLLSTVTAVEIAVSADKTLLQGNTIIESLASEAAIRNN